MAVKQNRPPLPCLARTGGAPPRSVAVRGSGGRGDVGVGVAVRAPGLATSLVDDPAATQRERRDDRKDESDQRPVDRAPALFGPALDHFPGRHATSVPVGHPGWKGSGRMSHSPQNWAWTND